MKHLQKLYDEPMSYEDIDVADPYADCNTSDEYEPSESKSSNDDYKVLPKKAKRLKKSEVNESTQDDQPESDEPEQEDDENSVSNLNWDTIDGSKLKKFNFEVKEVGIKTEYYAEYNREPYFFQTVCH
ncbi:hypothetical protein HHI36_010995 [Cryptolaemus montrouzieri]|uniref:Uncharacterized protein n=1 Tax=Cryptolaemus montrouzieri TaxID=559131 RepID=A0ABD2MKC1_9CUCU